MTKNWLYCSISLKFNRLLNNYTVKQRQYAAVLRSDSTVHYYTEKTVLYSVEDLLQYIKGLCIQYFILYFKWEIQMIFYEKPKVGSSVKCDCTFVKRGIKLWNSCLGIISFNFSLNIFDILSYKWTRYEEIK